MDFKSFFIESSLEELLDSAIQAFPHTTKRQHATGPINIVNVRFTPYVGVRTLLVRANAQNEGREYNTLILFRGVNFNENGPANIEVRNQQYFFENLSAQDDEVHVRCNCADFAWRFNYYDHLDQSLFSRVRAPYQSQGGPPANPQEMPGLCKHLIKLMEVLGNEGILIQ